MKLLIGIVGLPNVGKSTLFNILTSNEADAQNYPFCTIDPNVGVVEVPDDRLEKISELSNSKETTPAVVEFYDIAGLVRGANKGEGLGNQFLSHIREVDAVLMVLRVFENDEVLHVEQSIDPVRDMDIINTELALKDMDILERMRKSIEGEAKTGDKHAKKALGAIEQILGALEEVEPLHAEKYKESLEILQKRGAQLLSAKRQMYVLNGAEEEVSDELKAKLEERNAGYVVVDLSRVDAVSGLIKEAYNTLDLISYFTTGEKQTRAWAVRRGAKAPEAAGVIHSDFEEKFIRAEVIYWEKLLEAGSWQAAKRNGWIRLEGKDYVVQDGDVIYIRHGA